MSPHMNRLALSFAACLPFLAGCSLPAFRAKRTVEFTVPAPQLTALVCESHNGGITVQGGSHADEVKIKAELSVGGTTQREADDNVQLLEVATEWQGSTLRVFGKFPQQDLGRMSPGFTFWIDTPEQVALDCTSHNGGITAQSVRGDQKLVTHNGSLRSEVRGGRAHLVTHNGNVKVDFATAGSVQGNVESHNGSIEATFAPGCRATLEASTANGSVTSKLPLTEMDSKRNRVHGKLGDGGEGKLVLSSHNGSVSLR